MPLVQWLGSTQQPNGWPTLIVGGYVFQRPVPNNNAGGKSEERGNKNQKVGADKIKYFSWWEGRQEDEYPKKLFEILKEHNKAPWGWTTWKDRVKHMNDPKVMDRNVEGGKTGSKSKGGEGKSGVDDTTEDKIKRWLRDLQEKAKEHESEEGSKESSKEESSKEDLKEDIKTDDDDPTKDPEELFNQDFVDGEVKEMDFDEIPGEDMDVEGRMSNDGEGTANVPKNTTKASGDADTYGKHEGLRKKRHSSPTEDPLKSRKAANQLCMGKG
ncbi:MAG: hypothetical protein M1823_004262 [Watsoniomyces obsoletus]|nr:MAG: hypothetical protein M1823_004262 [Watsoniomyces obsoletus]